MSSLPQNPDVIFAEAIEIESPMDRAAFLNEACRGDETLRREVEWLVQNHFRAGDFLENPARQLGPIVDQRLSDDPGTEIGPYKLLEQIGEGGFGVVYLAEQTRPVRRRVALKIIKPGMDTRAVIARFEAERQALALMDHPNIAKVFDAGATEHGRPYFVMELVHGVPITEYCDQCNLTTGERLELFVTVCHAVQHAHQKGVVHRDLKPTNVLVAMQDGRPAPKIIDFGVAKAVNQRLTENSLATGFAQMIGTPLYMSPEQAELSPLGVDTRTDIYSLGVLLYELLTGTTPFEKERLRVAPFDELRRIIREEEPPRPSTRISTLAADLATTVAQRHRADNRRLLQTVRGDLDWIVMKCLEKDRNRRYETANNLAIDVQNYLRHEPVQACPPSARYRLSKFARRNRATLLTAGIILGTLVIGTVVSVWLAVRAIEAEGVAAVRLKAESLAHQEAEASFQKARQAVDDMYTQVAEKWLANQPQMEPLQREFLTKALKFYTESVQPTSDQPDVRFETARAYRRMAEIQHRLGESAEAETAFRQAVDRLQALADEFPSVSKYRSELAVTLHQLGVLFGDTGRYSDEEQAHRRALAIRQELAAQFPAVTECQSALGRAHFFVGQALCSLHRREEAEREFRAGLDIQYILVDKLPAVPEYRHDLAQTHLRLGQVLGYLGRPEEYRQALREAAGILEKLATEFPALPAYRNELANVYYWMMRKRPANEAEDYLRRALALQETLAAEYPSVTDYRYDLSRSQKVLGDLLVLGDRTEEAEDFYSRAASNAEKLVADAPTVHYYRARQALVELARGDLFKKSGKPTDAKAAYDRGITLFKSLVEEYPGVWQYRPHLSQAYSKLALLLTVEGRTEDASRAHREALRFGPESPDASMSDDIEPLALEKNRQLQQGISETDEIEVPGRGGLQP